MPAQQSVCKAIALIKIEFTEEPRSCVPLPWLGMQQPTRAAARLLLALPSITLPIKYNVQTWRRACYGVLRFIMESGAKGCEVIVSGKLRAQRAKAMKFKDGYMIASGNPVREYIDGAVRHVMLRQGVLGIKVRTLSGRPVLDLGLIA